MLVGFGQTICLPVNPRCDLCHLGQMEDSPCPSKRKVFVKQALAKKKEEEAASHIPSGEVGLMADTELAVEETESKPIVDIKLESALGPSGDQQSNGSMYFNSVVKTEENTSLSW